MVWRFIFVVESGGCGEFGAQGGLTRFLSYCDVASAFLAVRAGSFAARRLAQV